MWKLLHQNYFMYGLRLGFGDKDLLYCVPGLQAGAHQQDEQTKLLFGALRKERWLPFGIFSNDNHKPPKPMKATDNTPNTSPAGIPFCPVRDFARPQPRDPTAQHCYRNRKIRSECKSVEGFCSFANTNMGNFTFIPQCWKSLNL